MVLAQKRLFYGRDDWIYEDEGIWFGSTTPITRDHWLRIERWKALQWVPVVYSWVE